MKNTDTKKAVRFVIKQAFKNIDGSTSFYYLKDWTSLGGVMSSQYATPQCDTLDKARRFPTKTFAKQVMSDFSPSQRKTMEIEEVGA